MKRPKLFSYLVTLLLSLTLFLLLAGSAFAQITYENIYADYSKFYSHFSPKGKHTDTENYKAMPIADRHAACADCHDPHSATRSPSPLGSYFGAGTQANVSGVRPFYTGVPAGGTPKFVFLSSVVKEYELCFKCHSSYSWGAQSPPKFNWTKGRYWQTGDPTSDIVVQETDTAKEFNPNNASYLPVIAKGKTPGTKVLSWAGNKTFNETFVPGLSADSYIKCSDCHGSDSTTVKGPHGSSHKYILKRKSPQDESTTTVTTSLGRPYPAYTAKDSYTMTWNVRTDDNVCYECHRVEDYGYDKGHPTRRHANSCGPHNPIDLSRVGCATCKVMPIHGSATNAYMMKDNWCNVCHVGLGGYGRPEYSYPSCPRFYSYDERGDEKEEVRVHFQSARMKPDPGYALPLPTPDMPNLKGLGTEPSYRYYNREDDYILFKEGKPKEENGFYKVKFDQPSIGERPDGEPIGEVGYEDQISLWTVDHEVGTQAYLSVDGDVCVVKDTIKPKKATDNQGNDIMPAISERTASEDEKDGWFTGQIGYGNSIDEIYAKGNSFILEFGDLSEARVIRLLWRVGELKGGKLPVLIQTQDAKGKWVTRGSARHAEDRYGAIDLTGAFPRGTKSYKVKVIPTLNFVDWMAVSVKDQSFKLNKLNLSRADYTKYLGAPADATPLLRERDGNYLSFDYGDQVFLYFAVPGKDKRLTKRSFVFAPVGYYETGGPPSEYWSVEPMTAEKAQDFARVSPAGGFANHYNIELIDLDEWNERHGIQAAGE